MDAVDAALLERVAAATRAWAAGDLPRRAALEIALTTNLAEQVVPDYLDWLSEGGLPWAPGRIEGRGAL